MPRPDIREIAGRLRVLAVARGEVTDTVLAGSLERIAADLDAALAGAFPVAWGRDRTPDLVIPLEDDHAD